MWEQFFLRGMFFVYLSAFILFAALFAFVGRSKEELTPAHPTLWANPYIQVLLCVITFLLNCSVGMLLQRLYSQRFGNLP